MYSKIMVARAILRSHGSIHTWKEQRETPFPRSLNFQHSAHPVLMEEGLERCGSTGSTVRKAQAVENLKRRCLCRPLQLLGSLVQKTQWIKENKHTNKNLDTGNLELRQWKNCCHLCLGNSLIAQSETIQTDSPCSLELKLLDPKK